MSAVAVTDKEWEEIYFESVLDKNEDQLLDYERAICNYRREYEEVADKVIAPQDGVEERLGIGRAERYLDDMFSSICWRTAALKDGVRIFGVTDHNGRTYARWRHRAAHELPNDTDALEIDQEALYSAVGEYADHPEVHTRYLDWWCADTVMYAEIAAAAAAPALSYHTNGTSRIKTQLVEMLAAYQVLRSEHFSWDVLWQELNRTRDLGAVWPGELYKLAEMKRGRAWAKRISESGCEQSAFKPRHRIAGCLCRYPDQGST